MLILATIGITILSYLISFFVINARLHPGVKRICAVVNFLSVSTALYLVYRLCQLPIKEMLILFFLYIILYFSIRCLGVGLYYCLWRRKAQAYISYLQKRSEGLWYLLPHLRQDFWDFLRFCELPV